MDPSFDNRGLLLADVIFPPRCLTTLPGRRRPISTRRTAPNPGLCQQCSRRESLSLQPEHSDLLCRSTSGTGPARRRRVFRSAGAG